MKKQPKIPTINVSNTIKLQPNFHYEESVDEWEIGDSKLIYESEIFEMDNSEDYIITKLYLNILYNKKIVGEVSFQQVLGCMCSPKGLFFELDGESQQLCDIYTDFFPKGKMLPIIEKKIGYYENFYFLDSIKIEEQYQNQGIGTEVIKYFVESYVDKPIFLISCPLHPSEIEKTELKKRSDKLNKLYTGLGFKQIKHSCFVKPSVYEFDITFDSLVQNQYEIDKRVKEFKKQFE